MIVPILLVAVLVQVALCSPLPSVRSSIFSAVGGQSAPHFDTIKAVEAIPDTLVKTIEGNDSIRRKFESLCRNAQVSYCCDLSGDLTDSSGAGGDLQGD